MRLVNVGGKCYECDDYRPIAEQFIPEVLKLINSEQDEVIQERFLGRMLGIHQVIDAVGSFTTTVNKRIFFDVIFDAIENDIKAQELLRFINNCIKEATGSIGSTSSNKIKTIINQMIINETGSGFYTSIAELACFNEILKNGKLRINGIEKKLPNGKSMDMVVGHNGGDCYIDIVSIFFQEGKIHSNEDMYNFLNGRLTKKYNAKFHGLDNIFLKDCAIMPVLWGELGEFKQYEEALEKIVATYKNQIIPPYGLVYLKQQGYYFKPIKSILKKMSL